MNLDEENVFSRVLQGLCVHTRIHSWSGSELQTQLIEFSRKEIDLQEGDRLYFRVFESGLIPDAETICLNYLPTEACWPMFVNSNYSEISNKRTPLGPCQVSA